jgi:CRISPR-associated endonuclease/helicase Cas3
MLAAEEQEAGSLVALLAGLHDLGKASPSFQRLRRDLAAASGLELGYGEPRPHGIITARELKTVLRDGYVAVCASPVAAGILAQIAGAHHGVFAQAYDIQRLGSDTLGDSKWVSVRATLAVRLWQLINHDRGAPAGICLQDPTDPAAVPVLAGLISVADWIGSNTDHFPLDPRSGAPSYSQDSTKRAHQALSSIGWLPTPEYAAPAPFSRIFQFAPNDMQRAVSELIDQQPGPFLLVIEAQMGQGKTEAALYAADASLCRGQSRGLYVALPTQATSNAMFDRVKHDYLQRRGHANVKENMQLVHGNALLAEALRISGIGGEGGGEDQTISARSWFTARKRPLLAPFGVGTIDQALLSVLQTRHWFVRLFGLANKVVIFDEVHAYDTYTSTLLDRLIEWLSALKCTVVLLSATLPRKRLQELVAAYGAAPPAGPAEYPRITLATQSRSISASAGVGGEAKPVALEFVGDEPSEVAHLASERLSEGGCAAIICNTVGRAQRLYTEIRTVMPDCECILFHARTPFGWRKETEDGVLRKFGKPNREGVSPGRPQKAVVVATQVIEQSLDLDFDWILTEMAPIDLILQRLGREHRHERSRRPAAVSSPVLTILSDSEVGGPPPAFRNAGVYERYVLLRSWLALTRQADVRLTLPGDIDRFVQWVYGEEEPEGLDAEWAQALLCSREASRYTADEDARKAERILVPRPGYPEDIIAAFNKDLGEDEDPSIHESVKAATRDGDPSIQVVCLKRDEGKLSAVCGAVEVDLESEPGRSLTVELLASSVSVQTKGLYHALRDQQPPAGWKKSTHLRFHRAVEFVDAQAPVGPYRLRLTRELGLVIEKEGS